MIGKRFGRLVVIAAAPKTTRQKKWVCQCDCGAITTPFEFSLKENKSKSCGCIAAQKSKDRWANATEEMRLARSKQARTHGMSKHPAYQAWADMRQRCTRPSHKWFTSYGGRGIKVCAEWDSSFEAFWQCMGSTWEKGLTLGRIDNDGDYEPTNCRWETKTQQQNNRSVSRYIETPTGFMTISQAAREYGISHGCLKYRVDSGWSYDRLFKKSMRSQA